MLIQKLAQSSDLLQKTNKFILCCNLIYWSSHNITYKLVISTCWRDFNDICAFDTFAKENQE